MFVVAGVVTGTVTFLSVIFIINVTIMYILYNLCTVYTKILVITTEETKKPNYIKNLKHNNQCVNTHNIFAL